MAVRPFDRELNLNEGHSCIDLPQHGAEFVVDRSLINKRFSDARGKGRMSDAKMLFYDFSEHIGELENTIYLVIRLQGAKDLTMEIRGILMEFTSGNVFRTYHLLITDKEARLMQYGLTMGSQDRLHRGETRGLSPTISFHYVYLE